MHANGNGKWQWGEPDLKHKCNYCQLRKQIRKLANNLKQNKQTNQNKTNEQIKTKQTGK